jgi:D-xylose transport system permease protein
MVVKTAAGRERDQSDGVPGAHTGNGAGAGNGMSDESEWGGDIRPTSLAAALAHLRPALSLRRSGVVYGFILVVVGMIVFSIYSGRPPYLAASNVGNLLDQMALTGILAIGMTVLLISGNFDLSVGSLTALTAMSTALVAKAAGPMPAVAVGLLVGMAGGAFNGIVHWKIGLNSFIVTLGTLIAYRGLTQLISGSRSVNVSGDTKATLESWGGGYVHIGDIALAAAVIAGVVALVGLWQKHRPAATLGGVVAVVMLVLSLFTSYPLRLSDAAFYMLMLLGIVGFILRFTVTGRRLYATGGNIEAARASGVVVSRYRVVPFIVVGTCAGIAGVLWTMRLASVDPNAFTSKELDVLAAAIIGGVALTGGSGSVVKSIVGTALLVVLTNGFNILNVPPAMQMLAQGAIILGAAGLYMLADRRAKERA